MQYFKKFVVALKKMGIKINPGVVLMIVLAVTLAVVLWRWWAARRRGAEASADAPPAAPVKAPTGPPPVPKDRFLNIWRRFVGELPPVVRRSLHQFQPVVVLGGLAAGKTALISRHTDWQRQARYLFGSQLGDPDLQIYLGSRVLVVELPSSVLAGTERGLRDALLNLFRRLFRRRTPIVVVAINPLELQQMAPDETRALADAIRGKINLLSFVRRRPIEVRLAVTHMDRLSGFADLAETVRRHGGTFEIPMEGEDSGASLQAHFAHHLYRLADMRSTALLALDAERYLKVVTFLREAPKLLAPVGGFASALLAPEPLSRQPELSAIHLTSAQVSDPVSAPFRVPAQSDDRLRSPLVRHRIAAVAIGVVLSIALGGAYVRERGLWFQAKSALRRYATETTLRQRPELEAALRTQIMAFIHRRAFPSFFEVAERKAAKTVAARLRQDFVLHNLNDALAHPRGARRAVYLAALADAEPDGDVAMRLEGDEARARWSASTGLTASMIEDYVAVAGALGADQSATVTPESDVWLDDSQDASARIETLYSFARDVRRAIERADIDEAALASIRSQARLLRRVLAEITTSPDVPDILQTGATEDPSRADLTTRLTPYLLELQAPDLLAHPGRRNDLMAFLELVESTRIRRPPTAPRRYLDVCEWIALTLGAAQPRVAGGQSKSDPAQIEVAVEGRLLRGSEWLALTRDHTVIEVVRAYLSRPLREKAVFFVPGVEHPSMIMNPSTQGAFLFSGRARIPGRYTREALFSNVVPTLACHAKTLPALRRIDTDTAKELDTVVKREVERYSEVYARSMWNYYGAFDVRTDGATANLRVVLDRLLRGSSPLTRHLVRVGENARLDRLTPDVREHLGPLIDRLEPFRAVDEVVSSTVSGEPAYKSYLLFVRQVQEALQPAEPAASMAESQPVQPDTLRDRLGPAGRMAMDILTCAPESKDVAVHRWLDDVGLRGDLRDPFLVPIEQLYEVGRREIEQAMRKVWRYDLRSELSPLLLRFPFNLTSADDATPEHVTAILHPATGSLANLRARLVDPLFHRPAGCEVHYRTVRLPRKMKPMLSWAKRLARILWDESGQPQALIVPMAPVPFESVVSDARKREVQARLTMAFISVGASTLVNFNQRPFSVGLVEPWTTVHTAQVGIKLTDLATQEEVYPDPLVESSHWALMRLLFRARRKNARYTWPVRFGFRGPNGRSSRIEVPVSFEAAEDPFKIFSRRRRTRRMAPDEKIARPPQTSTPQAEYRGLIGGVRR